MSTTVQLRPVVSYPLGGAYHAGSVNELISISSAPVSPSGRQPTYQTWTSARRVKASRSSGFAPKIGVLGADLLSKRDYLSANGNNIPLLKISPYVQSRLSSMLHSSSSGHVIQDALDYYFIDPIQSDKINGQIRDSAVSQLISLHKAFFDFSPETLCRSVVIIDHFITRVRVRPKYMACVATAAYSMACAAHERSPPTDEQLVNLTSCGVTVLDLAKMRTIILSKLDNQWREVSTACDYLAVILETVSCGCHCLVGAKPPLSIKGLPAPSSCCSSRLAIPAEAKTRINNRIFHGLAYFGIHQFSTVCLVLAAVSLELDCLSSVQDRRLLQRWLEVLRNVCSVSLRDLSDCAAKVDSLFQQSYQPRFPTSWNRLCWVLSRRTRENLMNLQEAPMRFEVIPEQQQNVLSLGSLIEDPIMAPSSIININSTSPVTSN